MLLRVQQEKHPTAKKCLLAKKRKKRDERIWVKTLLCTGGHASTRPPFRPSESPRKEISFKFRSPCADDDGHDPHLKVTTADSILDPPSAVHSMISYLEL